MIKVVALFKKKDGLSDSAFRDHYENNHIKLFAEHLRAPGILRYARRYLTPIRDAISGESRSSGFDVVMELWFEDDQSYRDFFEKPMDQSFRTLVAADEEKLFDRDSMFLHTVEEYETDLTAFRSPTTDSSTARS
ncbi:EthD domain-containing protein [Rhodococcus sp. USK13]|uniref:EthD domain-containing protein n=1 Tax=Rhodococcus sp. USK13 TaxID=2806442 RepID=UPI001BCD53D4|nr:EthD domain-containing protein [Rhodococcus sp. USK13]